MPSGYGYVAHRTFSFRFLSENLIHASEIIEDIRGTAARRQVRKVLASSKGISRYQIVAEILVERLF